MVKLGAWLIKTDNKLLAISAENVLMNIGTCIHRFGNYISCNMCDGEFLCASHIVNEI
jgi:hypothetical protein